MLGAGVLYYRSRCPPMFGMYPSPLDCPTFRHLLPSPPPAAAEPEKKEGEEMSLGPKTVAASAEWWSVRTYFSSV